MLLAGERLRPAQGDLHQMGGDFVVDQTGIIRFAHRSKYPVDQLSVDTLQTDTPLR